MSLDHLSASEPWYPATRETDRKDYLALGAFLLRPALDALGRAGRPALFRVIDAAGSWMRSVARHLVLGTFSLGQWFNASSEGLIGRHYAGALALTSGETPTPEALDTLDREIDRQAGLLLRWKQQMIATAGGILIPDAGTTAKGILNRAARYGGAIWGTAMKTLRRMRGGSAKQERRRLEEGAHHCGDCPYWASLGWQRPGVLADIGDTVCREGCRCWFIFR
ncbi:MAG: hypothetical protein ABI353_11475 [Isosphaeraceae bacterium]